MEQKVDPYMREAPWVCCPMCDEDVCVGRFNCPEIAEWRREKREKDEAEGVVRTRKRMCWSETRGWTQTARSLISA